MKNIKTYLITGLFLVFVFNSTIVHAAAITQGENGDCVLTLSPVLIHDALKKVKYKGEVRLSHIKGGTCSILTSKISTDVMEWGLSLNGFNFKYSSFENAMSKLFNSNLKPFENIAFVSSRTWNTTIYVKTYNGELEKRSLDNLGSVTYFVNDGKNMNCSLLLASGKKYGDIIFSLICAHRIYDEDNLSNSVGEHIVNEISFVLNHMQIEKIRDILN